MLLIVTTRKIRKRREEARNAALRQAHDRLHVRYGENPSWHPEMTLEQIQDIALAIDDTIAQGPRDFPSPRDLQPLLPVLATRTPEVFPADLPDEARQLLDVFARENQEKAARLEALRLA